MARSYLILLFSFVFFVAGGLLFWRGEELKEQKEEKVLYAESLTASIAAQKQQLSLIASFILDQTGDLPSSYRYRQLRPILEELAEMLAPNGGQVCSAANSDIFTCALENTQRLSRNIQDTLLLHHTWLDYSLDQAQERIDKLNKKSTAFTKQIEELSKADKNHTRLRAEMDYLLMLSELVRELGTLSASKADFIDSIFPVVQASQISYAQNEKGSCIVSIGHYSPAYQADDVEIRVDGKSYTVAEDGRLKINLPTESRGNNTIDLACSITNLRTGEVRSGKSTFTYHVR